MENKPIALVTGGAGFIGSNIARALVNAGYSVVISDWLGLHEKWKNLQDVVFHDIINPDRLPIWLAENGDHVAAIIHMGAISATTERDVDLIVERNVRLSIDLWSFATARQIPFIYASSAATYGDGNLGFVDSEDMQDLLGLRPLNPYGWSKLAVDRRFVSDVREGRPHPPQWAGLRFFNVYGPHEAHKNDMRSVVNKMFPVVQRGETVSLFKSHRADYADGGQLRDFIHVDDCVAVVLWLLRMPSVSGIFNVGTGVARSFRELAEATFSAAGAEVKIVYNDMPVHIRDRYQYYTQADMSKLRRHGFNGEFMSLEAGVGAYVAAMTETRDLYDEQ